MLKPGLTERWRFLDRFRLAALARPAPTSSSSTIPSRRSPGSSCRPDVRIIQLWHAAGAFKTVGYSRAGKPGDPNPFVRSTRTTRRDRQLRARRAVLRRGVRDPGGARRPDRDPADGPLLRRGGAGGGLRGGARRLPGDRRPDDDPVRADLPRRHDPRRVLRLRAARLRRAPRAVRRAATRSSSSRCTRSCSEPLGIPEPFRDRLLDGSRDRDRRQRPAVRGRPAHHRLLVDRVRVLDPRPADAVLRLRPRRVRRDARLLRPVRVVRARPDRADVPRAARRHPARRLRGREGRRVRRPPLRPPRRRLDRPGHRPADPRLAPP